MSAPSLYIVDVFAERPYAGNQLAVVVGAGHWSTERMQEFAHEMNFSETTFVTSPAAGGQVELRDGGYDVRIFTPSSELPFAGHPTLGTAWVLRRFLAGEGVQAIKLNLGIGQVPVAFESGEHGELAWMSPRAPDLGAIRNVSEIASILGLPLTAMDQRFPCRDASIGIEFVLVPLRSLEALRAMRPGQLPATAAGAVAGVLLFCQGAYDGGGDIAARMFFDAYGVREDPATGSANACLAAYLSAHRCFGSERVSVRVQQGYEIDRPSSLYLQAESPSQVRVGGKVVLVAKGELA